MRFVVTGGGTGGHIYPALAIARGILARYPEARVLYIGREGGLEAELVPRANLPFYAIPAAGLKRSLTLRNLLVFWQATRGILQARKILAGFKPQVVVGTGGYVCGPVVLAAVMMGIPTMIHEQNALPGLTNRLLARFVNQVALTFEEARKYMPRRARIKVTGLPVRPEIMGWQKDEARRAMGLPENARLILSFGGSQGARTINRAMIEVLKHFYNRDGVYFLHVTGPRHYKEFCQQLGEAGLSRPENGNIILVPYLDEMPRAMAAADLAICRAGAATLSELTAVGLPAILVPYPHATGNHQEYNARSLEREGAALVIRDQDLTGPVLCEKLTRLLERPAELEAMARASRRLGRPRALEEIVEIISELARQ